MANKAECEAAPGAAYRSDLRAARLQLSRLQRHAISRGLKALVVFEGRDAAATTG